MPSAGVKIYQKKNCYILCWLCLYRYVKFLHSIFLGTRY